MARGERYFEMFIPPRAAANLTDRGSMFDTELIVRVHDDRVTAHYPGGRYSSPPHFTGRLERLQRGARLVGSIRETRGEAWVAAIYGLAALLMIAIAVFGIAGLVHGETGALAPTLIGLLALLPMGAFWIYFRTNRAHQFARQADELAHSLRNYALTGKPAMLL